MDDDIVRVPLEWQMPPLLQHPPIKRIMQKQVCQQWADDSSLRSATFTLRQGSVLFLRGRFQPTLDIQNDPLVLHVLPNRPQHQIMIDVVEETFAVQVTDPVEAP